MKNANLIFSLLASACNLVSCDTLLVAHDKWFYQLHIHQNKAKTQDVQPMLHIHTYTVNGERFAGVNFCGFHPMKFFIGKLLQALHLKHLKALLYEA